MNEIVRRSKQLSRLLRHTAGERGLAMTADGWAPVADVCTMLDIDRTTLLRAVEHNDKSRLQLDGDRIRAGQGHSRAGMPVTLDALERSWRKVEPDDLLWHGTSVSAVEGIAWHVPVSCISRVESASEAGAEALESVRHALLGDAVHWVGWSGR